MKSLNALAYCGMISLGLATMQSQIMISGNENKIDLSGGGPQVVAGAPADNLSILDFCTFPPRVEVVEGVSNTVIGPPSNIAIAPGGKLALIADSLKLDPTAVGGTAPNDRIHVLDLSERPARVIGEVRAGQQPSGMSFSPDGSFVLVANRAGGTISHFRVEGKKVTWVEEVEVCKPTDSLSDVAIDPAGRWVLASVQVGGYLQVLEMQKGKLKLSERKVSVYGKPYRCVITPDGAFGLTAGAGFGNGLDVDALTVVDLKGDAFRAIDHIPVGASPESLEVSPDGRLVAVVVMDGSNLAAGSPGRKPTGTLVILARKEGGYEKVQTLDTGAIPEGVAFTSDGRYLVVQGHPARQLYLYAVEGLRVRDTGFRITTPGMPSSLRSGM